MSNNKIYNRLSIFETYLQDTKKIKAYIKTDKKKKYNDVNNTSIQKVVPKKIKCSQLKKSQYVDYNDKIWEIINFTNIPSKNKCSFIVFDHYTELKKEFIFPKTFIFEINENGYIIL